MDRIIAPPGKDPVQAIVVQPDGKILIAGAFHTVNDVPRTQVARLRSDGSIDFSLETGTGPGTPPNGIPEITALAVELARFVGLAVPSGAFNGAGDGPFVRLQIAPSLESAPSIIKQPSDQTNLVGLMTTFTPEVGGYR